MTILYVTLQRLTPFMTFYSLLVLLITLVGFLLMGYDKYRAGKNQERIPEVTFMGLALCGGAIGILLGMVIFNHKVNKKKFRLGIPLCYMINQILHLTIFNWLVK